MTEQLHQALARVAELTAAVERVRSIHLRREGAGGEGYCRHCRSIWPCPSITALVTYREESP